MGLALARQVTLLPLTRVALSDPKKLLISRSIELTFTSRAVRAMLLGPELGAYPDSGFLIWL